MRFLKWVVKILDIYIEFNLIFEDLFINAKKYIEEGSPKYIVNSKIINDVIIDKKLTLNSKYYDLYELEDKSIYQVQKDENNKIVGTINYKGNLIEIGLIDNTYISEYLLSQYVMAYIAKENNAILMHGSSLVYKNKGIIFTAKSGTGKSTHSRLWQKYEDSLVLNDDKNLIKIKDDKLYLYPSFWSGKHRLDNNIISTLDAIVFLYQSKENVIRKLSKKEAFKLLLTQISSLNYDNLDLWNNITDKLLNLPCYYLGCNMEKNAYLTLKNQLEVDLWR